MEKEKNPTPIQDEELANIICLEFFGKWCEHLKTQEGREELEQNKNLFAKAYKANPQSPGAKLFAAFVAGMTAGLEITARMDALTKSQKEQKGE